MMHCGAAASGVLDAFPHDTPFWAQLLRRPEVSRHIIEALKVNVMTDPELARAILTEATACVPGQTSVAASSSTPASSSSSRPPALTASAALPAFTQLALPPTHAASPGTVARGLKRKAPAEYLAAKAVAAAPSASGLGLLRSVFARRTHEAARLHGPGAYAARLLPGPSAIRCSDISDLQPRSSAAAAKRVSAPQFMQPLPACIGAKVAGYSTFGDKFSWVKVCRGAMEILSYGAAWDPLKISRAESILLLRFFRDRDPVLSNTSMIGIKDVPAGLFEINSLEMDLMDADGSDFDEEEEARMMQPRKAGDSTRPVQRPFKKRRKIVDPLEDMIRRLRHDWRNLQRLEVHNIADFRLDNKFLQLRGTTLAEYPKVRVRVHREDKDKYSLTATKRTNEFNEPWDVNRAMRACSERRPNNPFLRLESPTDFNHADSIFLEEHEQVFKSGDKFHVSHAPWRTFETPKVRRRYSAFPDRAAGATASSTTGDA